MISHRNITVEYLRGLAILLVIGIHFFDLCRYVTNVKPSGVYSVFGHGYWGVNIFFVISGFLIASTSVRDSGAGGIAVDTARFYIRRVTRILPLLSLVILIGMAVLFLSRDSRSFEYLFKVPGATMSASFWLAIAAFGFNWYRILDGGPTGGWFGLQWDILWSLAVEEQFYILFPFIIRITRTRDRLRAAMIAFVVTTVLLRMVMRQLGYDEAYITMNSVTAASALAIGIVVAVSDPWHAGYARPAAMLGVVGIVVCYGLGYAFDDLTTFALEASVGLVIQASRSVLPGSSRLVKIPLLAEVGRVSYGAYLYHPVVFYLASPWLIASSVNRFVSFFVVVTALVIVAEISLRLFERPVETRGRQYLYARLTGPDQKARIAP